jgi:hypothetical protein
LIGRVRDRWRSRPVAGRTFRVVFGDRLGLVVALVALAFAGATWRVGIFLTDTYAVANTLANVAEGQLSIEFIQYSITYGSQPGLGIADGTVYGRNYGHVFVSLPVLWLLEAANGLVDVALVLVAAWSLVVYGVFDQVGRLLGRHRPLAVAGSVVALVAFLANVAVAVPLSARWFPLVAIQVTTMLATAFAGVALYRLVEPIHGRRVAGLAGVLVVVATPVGFWASIPKRHVFSVLAVLVCAGAFYRSRAATDPRRALGLRALAYATVAVFAWFHAPEALVVLVALLPLDLLTAASNHPGRLAVVGLVFLVALTPFMATNYAISGNPAQPPRLLPSYYGELPDDTADDGGVGDGGGSDANTDGGGGDGGTDGGGDGGADGGGDDGTDGGGGDADTTRVETAVRTEGDGSATAIEDATTEDPADGSSGETLTDDGSESDGGSDNGDGGSLFGFVATLLAVVGSTVGKTVDQAVWALEAAWDLIVGGARRAIDEPDRLYHTFVRSGRIPVNVKYHVNDQEAIELTVLESAPYLAALTGSVAVALRSVSAGLSASRLRGALGDPARQLDAFAVVVSVLYVLVYMDRLPIHTQVTVRYLLPVFALGLYGVARLPTVHRVAQADWRWLAGPSLAVLVGGALVLAAVHRWLSLAVGEAMQLHALLALACAVPVGGWLFVTELGLVDDRRVDAVALAVPMGLGTLLLSFTALAYFQYGQYVVPAMKTVAELLLGLD